MRKELWKRHKSILFCYIKVTQKILQRLTYLHVYIDTAKLGFKNSALAHRNAKYCKHNKENFATA